MSCSGSLRYACICSRGSRLGCRARSPLWGWRNGPALGAMRQGRLLLKRRDGETACQYSSGGGNRGHRLTFIHSWAAFLSPSAPSLVAASAQPYSAPLQTAHTRCQLTDRQRHPGILGLLCSILCASLCVAWCAGCCAGRGCAIYTSAVS